MTCPVQATQAFHAQSRRNHRKSTKCLCRFHGMICSRLTRSLVRSCSSDEKSHTKPFQLSTYPRQESQFILPQPFFSASQASQLLRCCTLPVALQNRHGFGTAPSPEQRRQDCDSVEIVMMVSLIAVGMMPFAWSEFLLVFSFSRSSSSTIGGGPCRELSGMSILISMRSPVSFGNSFLCP